jgi:hypothetical protein
MKIWFSADFNGDGHELQHSVTTEISELPLIVPVKTCTERLKSLL